MCMGGMGRRWEDGEEVGGDNNNGFLFCHH